MFNYTNSGSPQRLLWDFIGKGSNVFFVIEQPLFTLYEINCGVAGPVSDN